MSEQAIARWNSIPMERTEDPSSPNGFKRTRPEDDDDDDDDDISLVSRSPSPVDDPMDVDGEDHLDKYDEYVSKPVREVITVDTKIKPTNRGFALLAKLGWVEGQPVGLSPDGRVDPVPFTIKSDLTGLGKTTQDVRMIETTVSQRRELDSERQQKESEEQRKLREDNVARKTALESEISSTLRAFYCTLCDKQFKTVAQYDEHTNSYAHHHKARFKDMQANVRIKAKDEIDKQKEKERKREEKQLRKIAAAAGVKVPKPSGLSAATSVVLAPTSDVSNAAGSDTTMDDGRAAEPKRGGWASVSASPGMAPTGASTSAGGAGFKRSGWATVGSTSSSSENTNANAISSVSSSSSSTVNNNAASAHPSSSSSSGRNTHSSGHLPTFRNAGWTSLDTGSSHSISNLHSYQSGSTASASHNAPQPSYAAPPPPPPPSSMEEPRGLGGWKSQGFAPAASAQSSRTNDPPTSSGGWRSSGFRPAAPSQPPPPPPPSGAPPPPPSFGGPPPPPSSSYGALPPPPSSFGASHPPPPPSNNRPPPQPAASPSSQAPAPPAPAQPVRSNWQQFQKGIGRKR